MRAGGWAVPALLGLAALLALFAAPGFSTVPVQRTIRIEAGDFAFLPAQVQVNPGDRVTIELVAKDVVHGLSIDGYAVDLQADPGQTARVTFTAGRPGTFKMRCSVACGNLHPFMTGKFSVGPNLLLHRTGALALLLFAGLAWGSLGKGQAG